MAKLYYDNITTIENMVEYVKIKLGYPVVCLEISDEQIQQNIYDSAQIMYRYMSLEASQEKFLQFKLLAGVTEYQIEEDLQTIFDFGAGGSSMGSTGELFTPISMMFSQSGYIVDALSGGGVGMGNGTYSPGGSFNNSNVLSSFNTTMSYLKDLDMTFGTKFKVQYSNLTKNLTVYPTPDSDTVGILKVLERVPIDNLFNHPLMKDLCVGVCMKQWATHLAKYNMTLPGGGTVDAQTKLNDADKMIDRAMDNIKEENKYFPFDVG